MKCFRWVKTMEKAREGEVNVVFGAWVFRGSWGELSLPAGSVHRVLLEWGAVEGT